MTRRAALQTLPGGITVPGGEEPLRIVEIRPSRERTARHDPRLLMAALTELAGVVTGAARHVLAVCLGGVPAEEVPRMIRGP